jgi:succinate dehydrogenase / fumarate reductase, flavoprotein subunit
VSDTGTKRRMQAPWVVRMYRSAVVKKWAMALSGIVLIVYVVAHLVGNLKAYLGPEELDAYGEALRDLGHEIFPRTSLLWLMRGGLAIAFVIHIHAAYSLTYTNWKARGGRYRERDYAVASYSSRTMRWTGLIVLLFDRRRHRAGRSASAAATLGELGYRVKAFTFHDSARRAHSIAAQGGINAAKNYHGDGDSVFRLFYDTVKGGDYRSREANVYRLAEVSQQHHRPGHGAGRALRPGVRRDCSTTARSAGRRSRGPSTPGARPASSCCSAPTRHSDAQVERHGRAAHPLRDARGVVVDGRAVGIVTRDLVTGEIERHSAHAVVLATGGYSNVFFLSTNAMASNVTAAWRAHRKGAAVRQPLLHPDPPDLHPGVRRVPVEADADVGVAAQRRRIWVPKDPDETRPRRHPRGGPRLLPRAQVPGLRQPRPARRRVPQRQGAWSTPAGRRARSRTASTSTSPTRSSARGRTRSTSVRQPVRDVRAHHRRGPLPGPMRIYPAPHYTMGGLWVDYNLMTTIPGCTRSGRPTSPTTAPTGSAPRR